MPRALLVLALAIAVGACGDNNAGNTDDAVCGDGVVEGSEACDGSALGGATCASLGFGDGDLLCTDTCTLETSGCVSGEVCDNDVDDDGDFRVDCDDAECRDQPHCPHCGDGEINLVAEQCDGADLGGATCPQLGVMSCTTSCTLDDTGCYAPEDCSVPGDEDKDGALDCADSDCTGDFACPVCGDDIVEQGEDCDGSVPAGVDCATFGGTGGTLSCGVGCAYDKTQCSGVELCAVAGDEDFDGLAECDDPDCSTAFNCPMCGNGVAQSGEQCDDGNAADNDGCLDTCETTRPLPLVGSSQTFTGTFTPDGTTPSRLFVRPYADPSRECIADAAPKTLEYFVYGFRNTGALDVDVTVTATFNSTTSGRFGSLWVYRDSFDPTAPLTNCDIGWYNGPSVSHPIQVAPGETIYAVISRGNANPGPDYVFEVKSVASCGDGAIGGAEQCDDGDTDPGTDAGDGCNRCTRETGWVCPADGSACYLAVCGNGDHEPDEDCDDGGTMPGDGCSSQCVLEGTTCTLPETLDRPAFADATDPVWTWSGNFGAATYSTEGAGTCSAAGGAGADAKAWFTAPVAGNYSFTVTASGNMALIVRDAACGATGSELACANASPSAGTEMVNLPLAANQTVFLIAEQTGTIALPFTVKADRYACSDGRISRPVETCDDLNTDDGDGCSSMCLVEFTPEVAEPNDTSSTSVTAGGATGAIDPATDKDVFTYPFTASAHTIRYSTSSAAPGVCTSGFGAPFLQLRVLDGGGTEVANSGASRCPTATFTPGAAGVYTIELTLAAGTATIPAYYLWIE